MIRRMMSCRILCEGGVGSFLFLLEDVTVALDLLPLVAFT